MIGTPKTRYLYYFVCDNKIFKLIPIRENVFPIFNFRHIDSYKRSFQDKNYSMIISYSVNKYNYILGIAGSLEVMKSIQGNDIANDLDSISTIYYGNVSSNRNEIINLFSEQRANCKVIKIVITNKRETSEIFICIATPQALIDRGYNVEILTN